MTRACSDIGNASPSCNHEDRHSPVDRVTDLSVQRWGPEVLTVGPGAAPFRSGLQRKVAALVVRELRLELGGRGKLVSGRIGVTFGVVGKHVSRDHAVGKERL